MINKIIIRLFSSKITLFFVKRIKSKMEEIIPGLYARDGLITLHNHDFINTPEFKKAYKRGVKANRYDYYWQWRVHVGLWAARYAAKLEGDFVECGASKSFLSSSIDDYAYFGYLPQKKAFDKFAKKII